VNTDQFWNRASDIFNLHRGRYRHAVLTDEEKLETVTDFLVDVESLACAWYNPDDKEE
jgi:hypothetical protein